MEAIPLDPKYHTYASKTSSDIISNFGFLFLGLYLLQKQKKLSLLALHFILIFVFSGYYHIRPSDERLMWDKIAIVTGAGSGVGRETAKKLSESDIIVILVGRREEKLNESTMEIIELIRKINGTIRKINKSSRIIFWI